MLWAHQLEETPTLANILTGSKLPFGTDLAKKNTAKTYVCVPERVLRGTFQALKCVRDYGVCNLEESVISKALAQNLEIQYFCLQLGCLRIHLLLHVRDQGRIVDIHQSLRIVKRRGA